MRKLVWAILILSLLIGGVYAALSLSNTTVFKVLNPNLAWSPQPSNDLGSLNAGSTTNIPVGFKNLDQLPLQITCSITGTTWLTWQSPCPATLAGGATFSTTLVLTIPSETIAGDYSFIVNVQGTILA